MINPSNPNHLWGTSPKILGCGPYSGNSTRDLFQRGRNLKIKTKFFFFITRLIVPLGETPMLPTRENNWSLSGPIRLLAEWTTVSPTHNTLSLIHMIYEKATKRSSLATTLRMTMCLDYERIIVNLT